jgi:hypothetical protein
MMAQIEVTSKKVSVWVSILALLIGALVTGVTWVVVQSIHLKTSTKHITDHELLWGLTIEEKKAKVIRGLEAVEREDAQ